MKIIDIIDHQDKYGFQRFVVVDWYSNFKYERKGDWLIGEDSGFFNFYYYQTPSKYFKAFAGRKFTIEMKDGTEIEASGQWWHGIPPDYQGLVSSVGVSSPEKLGECNVFSGVHVDPELINAWLAENEPSNNYDKYDKRQKDYGVHIIQSRWAKIAAEG